MWSVLGPMLRLLRGLRVMGAFVHGGPGTRARIILGAAIFGALGVFGANSGPGGVVAVLAVAFVGYNIYRAARRTFHHGRR